MSNRPLDREETEALKKIASGLRHMRGDWLGGIVFWNDVKRNVDAMLNSGTNDGEDIVEELDDEDAKERPWVMASDDRERWIGPYVLLASPPATERHLVKCKNAGIAFDFVRPLTPEEKARYSK